MKPGDKCVMLYLSKLCYQASFKRGRSTLGRPGCGISPMLLAQQRLRGIHTGPLRFGEIMSRYVLTSFDAALAAITPDQRWCLWAPRRALTALLLCVRFSRASSVP